MSIWAKVLLVVERGLLVLGLLLLATFSLAYIHRIVMSRGEMTNFAAQQLESVRRGEEAGSQLNGLDTLHQTGSVDHSLWSVQRTRSYEAIPGKSRKTLAVLRIPKLHLEVPVLEGTDELTLNRGVGRIAGTAYPGQAGNIGIAGHRDGFFRVLKDIRPEDSIELVTTSGEDFYGVDRIRITNPDDVSALRRGAKPSLTLVTCYPFYFVGPAPKRYIVEASLRR